MGASISGVTDLLKTFKSLGGSKDELANVLINSARPLRAGMKRHCPTDTTLLQQAIVIQDMSSGDEVKVGVGVFEPETVNYAIYQEFGTGKYATGEGGSRAKKIPWLWKVKSQKWADIFGIEVGESVVWYGNRPHSFVRVAYDEEIDNVVKLIETGLARVIAAK